MTQTDSQPRAGSRPRALIVKLGAIGDVIVTIPAARALAERGFAVEWVCGSLAAPLLRQYEWVRVIEVNERNLLSGSFLRRLGEIARLWGSLVGRRYSLCATLYYDSRYRILTLPVRASRKIMLSRSDRRYEMLPGRSRASECVRIVLGEEDSWNPSLPTPARFAEMRDYLPSAARNTRVVLVPGGARNDWRDDALRRWPVESYAALAERLLEVGIPVSLAGGPDDIWTLPYFAGCVDRLDVTMGRFSLLESLADMDGASVVVSHDTGPLHLAGMTKASIVALFGPTDPHVVLPQRQNALAIWGGEDLACRPCYDGRNFAPCKRNGCLADIGVELVEQHVHAMLASMREGHQFPPRVLSVPASNRQLQ